MGFSQESIAKWKARQGQPTPGWHDVVIERYKQDRTQVTFSLRGEKGWLQEVTFGLRTADLQIDTLHKFVTAAWGLEPLTYRDLLAWLRATPPIEWPATAMQDLARSVRQLAAADTAAVIDFGFAELLAFSSMMLLRCQLHVEKRLAECDAYPGDRTHLPTDLDQEGWLSRIERIARFLSELSGTWARVRHLTSLSH